jgi:GNAT superfamily N-acetyltransferase
VSQWPEDFELAWIEPALARGETWLASWGKEPPTGTITLSWADAAWFNDQEDAGYVHRLAVRRSAAGLGLALLDWAATECLKRGRRLLRLDCVTTNHELRHYYETHGFVHQGDVVVTGPPGEREQCETDGQETTVSLYQMTLRS